MKTAFLSVCLVVLVAAEARGQTVDQLLREALVKRDRGAQKQDPVSRRQLLEEALAIFRRAHEIERSGRTVGQLGIAEALLEKWESSEEHLQAALARDSETWVVRYQGLLRKWLGEVQGHFGALAVTGTPDGAAVWVDGKMRGTLPLPGPLRAAEGQVHLLVNAAGGYQQHQQYVTVKARTPIPVPVALEKPRIVELLSRPVDLENSAVSARPGNDRAPPVEAQTAHPPEGWGARRVLGVGLLATSVAGAATGITFLALHGKPACGDLPGGIQCGNLRDTKKLGWTFLAVGVVAAAGGGLLLYQGTRSNVSLAVSPTALIATGRF